MSLTKEYEDLKKIREEEGKKSNEHYQSVDLPGQRTKDVKVEEARQRIAEMMKEREKPNHD